MRGQNTKLKIAARQQAIFLLIKISIVCLALFAWTVFFFLSACRNPPKTDLRRLVPNETLVYLETNDVARALESLTASSAFQALAENEADFSALRNVQLAVAVTGFETSEENAALNFKPRFVAVIETHAWSWQTASFAENQIGNFVRKHYGENAKLELSEKANGKFFTWTAADNRRAFAFVRGSLIYFGNDEATIERCLTVENGEAESLLKNEALTRAYSENNLAFGFASVEAVAQIADFAGVSAAVSATEESGGRSFIARVLPQILRNTIREIVWTANKTERGIKDDFKVSLTAETAAVAGKTLSPKAGAATDSISFLPPDFFSATRYNLDEPVVAWNSLLFLTAKNTDPTSGKMLIQFSDQLLEPYGVSNAETFFASTGGEILTVRFDEDGEKSATVVTVKDAEKLKTSVSKEINFQIAAIKEENAEIWLSEDKQTAAAFVENKLVLGDYESVLKCLRAKRSEHGNLKNQSYQNFAASKSVAATFGTDVSSTDKIVGVLAKKKDESKKVATFYLTETRFTERGIERTTVSDFGLIGTVLKQFSN